MSYLGLTRRKFIGAASFSAVGLLLAACGGGGTTAATTSAAAATSAAPAATSAAATSAAATSAAPAATTTTAAAATTTSAAAATTTSAAAATSAPAASGGTINWLVRTDPVENKGQANVYEPALKNAGIKFTRIIIPSADYIPKINSMAAAKESLEIWGFGGNYMDYWARGLPQALDSYITADKWDLNSYFLPGLPAIYNIKGHQYGLNQLTCYGSNLVYNKDLLDKAGLAVPPVDPDDKSWTFDKLLTYAQKLTVNYGKPDATYGVSWALWDQMTSISYLMGTDSWLPEHYQNFIAQKSNFGNDGNVKGHQQRHDFIYKYQVHPDPSIDQGLNQFANPFQTGKIGMVMDGGWQYWTTSPIKDFKYGFAPVPYDVANKTIVFDDFWIMGRWAQFKDDAWKALRVLTTAANTTAYSNISGTPPTPRESTAPWLKSVADRTGQSVDDLTTLTQKSIDKSRVQESPDHLFLQHPFLDTTYTNEVQPFWAGKDLTADKFFASTLTQKMDDAVLHVYNQFKDSMPSS